VQNLKRNYHFQLLLLALIIIVALLIHLFIFIIIIIAIVSRNYPFNNLANFFLAIVHVFNSICTNYLEM